MDDAVRHVLTQGEVIDITTTGRKSGEPRRIEIVYHAFDGHVYISGYPRPQRRNWLANLEAHPRFTFHLKRSLNADLPAMARPISDPTERREVLRKVAVNWQRDDVDTMVEWSPLVEVTFPEA
jgi:deazaflavin-dependent oxidoreductase (nitroreductase family)